MREINIDFAPNQQAQWDFFNDLKSLECLYQGGVGSGKSEAASTKFIWLTLLNKGYSFIAAPTYATLTSTCVEKYIIPKCEKYGLRCSVHMGGKGNSRYPHLYIEGYKVRLMSGETPERFEGDEFTHGWCDEAAKVTTSDEDPLRDMPTQMRARVGRQKGVPCPQIILTSTPEGTLNWLYRDFEKNKIPGRAIYKGKTRLNAALDAGYYERLKAMYPEDLLAQYLEGEAVNFSAHKAHKNFLPLPMNPDRIQGGNLHDMDFIKNITYHIGMDFNVSPFCCVLAMELGGCLYFMDEAVIEDNGKVDDMIALMDSKGWGKLGHIIFHPDASSKNREMTGPSQVESVKKWASHFKWSYEVLMNNRNPDVCDRIDHFGSMIQNANKLRSLFVHIRCSRLIEELKTTGRREDGSYHPGPGKKRGHILDAASYVSYDIYKRPKLIRASNDVFTV
jgi:hypothetical protein